MRWALIVVAALLMAACGGGESQAPVATATPVPAADPTATQPPATPTTVPPQADVQIGKWQVRPAANAVQIYFEGEAVNEGEADAQEITVAIRLYDASGSILASERAFVIMDIIPAGGMSPFFGYVQGIEYDDIADTRIDIQFNTFDPESYHGFTYSLDVEIVQLRWTESGIVGELRNQDEFPLRLVQLAIIGYDEHDDVVAVERGTMDADQVEPGETAGFTSRFLAQDDVPVRVVAVAQGVRVR